MGTALRSASRPADEVFQLAEDVTGLPLRTLCDEGPLADLTRTSVAQVAVVAVSLAAAAYLEELLGRPPRFGAVAGHSVGELAAYCCAGALDVESTLHLVHRRGQLMERDAEDVDGTMVAVLNLDPARLARICVEAGERTGAGVEVANLNAPGQTVLSGARAAIAVASEMATAAGARRVIPLAVGGPFHSQYMEAAAADFKQAVSDVSFRTPHTPIVLNTTAEPTTDVEALRDELPRQITSPVRWEESIRTLARMGCLTFVELGSGQVLSGLARRILPEGQVVTAGVPDAVVAVADLFTQVASH